MNSEQEISKEFLLKALDKIDSYWNFLVIGLVAFIGWLVTSDTNFTPLLRVTAIFGYICFAGMNLVALRSAYLAAETASQDLSRSISTLALPRLIDLANSGFRLKGHLIAVYVIHATLGLLIVVAICLKSTEPQRWEYRRVDSLPFGSFTQARLDEIANAGWEIVGFSNTVDASGGHNSEMILKRSRSAR
ncbi:MAG: hypothetical protein AB7O66_04585 [Limisphaerales bacterium]